MSTQIYTGFRFKNPDMVRIRKQLLTFQSKVEEISLLELAKLKARHAVECFDCRTLGEFLPYDVNRKRSPVSYAARLVREKVAEIKDTRRRNPDYDFSFEITVFPLSKQKVLGIYFCDRREFMDLIQKQFWFLDYHYQNQCEGPEEISGRDWGRRKLDWDLAVPDFFSGVPAICGFTMCVGVRHLPSLLVRPEELMPHVTSYKERARRMSQHFFPGKSFKTKLTEEEQKSFFAVVQEIKSFEKTPAGKRARAQALAKVRKKIKKRITKTDLYGKGFFKKKRGKR